MKLRYLLPALLLGALPLSTSHAQIGVSINIAPPPLPIIVQPPCPVENYLWTPGYWAYADTGYYWVPGVWVAPPRIGFLWTPGYWGYNDGLYVFNTGYWGPTVGFYGGVNYGYGYGGYGYYGGRWDGGHFRYNTAVTRVNTTVIHNTYINKTVIKNYGGANASRASFNGPGGVNTRPDAQQLAAARGSHLPPTARQMAHQTEAQGNPAARSPNRPSPVAANRRGANVRRDNRFTNDGQASPRPARTAANRVRYPQNGRRNEVNRRGRARQPGSPRPVVRQARAHGGGGRPHAPARPRPIQHAPRKAANERKHNGH